MYRLSIVATFDTSQNIPVTLYCVHPEGEHQNAYKAGLVHDQHHAAKS